MVYDKYPPLRFSVTPKEHEIRRDTIITMSTVDEGVDHGFHLGSPLPGSTDRTFRSTLPFYV